MNFFKTRLYKASILLLIILSVGISGFMVLANYNFVDAIYMTIITITTVGFGEVHPLNQEAKIFTIVLILMSIFMLGYVASVFTELLISGQIFQQLKQKKVHKKIEKLKKHTIVCGYGRNGKQAMTKLKNYKKKFVVIEKNKEIISLLNANNILNIEGDATTDEILQQAGINNAENLITVLPSDSDNLFVVLTAKQLNKKCKIISRASKESSYNKLKIAGADNVIMPDKLGGEHMASLIVTPNVIEFVDQLTIAGETIINLEEVSVNNLPKKYLNKTILDLDLRRKTGCTVIGYKTPKEEYIINPDLSIKLIENSNLIVLGHPKQIVKLRELF